MPIVISDSTLRGLVRSAAKCRASSRQQVAHLMVSSRGFAMLEVLVTMIILLVGLLGLAGIMARSSTSEMESYQRVQALIFAEDMIDRMNSNRKKVSCYSNGATGVTAGTGFNNGSAPNCGANTTGEEVQAKSDLISWSDALKGSAEASGGTSFGAMIGARGCITQVNATDRIYRVSVAWQGLISTAAPPLDTCGQNQYGTDEAKRRVVTMTIRIAKLI